MNTHQRGFIPLVAIILLGITAVVGGTIATISIRNSNHRTISESDTKVDEPALAPVSARVESLAKDSQDTPSQPKPEHVEQIEKEKVIEVTTLDPKSQSICDQVIGMAPESTQRSLIQDMQVICEKYIKGSYEGGRLESAKEMLQQKWQLWTTTETQNRVSEFVARERNNQNTESANDNQAQISNQDQETYTESSTYPIILTFSDNYGNIKKRSDYNGYEGSYSIPNKATLHVGDIIKATIEAKDPKGRTLEYNWNASSQYFNDTVGRGKYTTSNTLAYTLTADDLKSAGETFRLAYQIRVSGTEYYRFGGGQYDDAGFIDYTLEP